MLLRALRARIVFAAALAGAWGVLHAQTFDLSHPNEPVMSIDGLWRFHPGDNPAWADPNFDDSQWPLLRSDRDWELQGYNGLSGFGWYRFAVVIPAGLDDVSITLPRINDAYEVYANGSLIGTFGKMPPDLVSYSRSGPDQTWKLPSSVIHSAPNGSPQQRIEIALRVWLRYNNVRQIGGGPERAGGIVGASAEVARQSTASRSASLFHYSPAMLVILLELLAAGGAFFLVIQQRSELEYLWFDILMLSRAGYDFAVMYQDLFVVNDNLINPIRVALSFGAFSLAELYFYQHLLKAKKTRWFRFAVACVLMNFFVALVWPLERSDHDLIALQSSVTLLLIPYYIWILVLLFAGAREKFMDAQWLLLPAVLQKLAQMWNRIGSTTFTIGWQHRFGLLTQLTTEPVRIDLVQLVNAIFLVAVFAILIRRFTRTRSQEGSYAREFADAREVQQYLIPAHLPATPGLAIESQYLPAREVGGDFFQVLPNPVDGSVLILVGDVAGKGLQAGMLATLIVGAVRTAASFTGDPARILALLNQRLQGRGLVTCLAIRIEKDGNAILANAGLLPPYLNGNELEMEGALPLGAVGGIEFPVMHFQLSEGDALVLMTDGIAEAQNAEGRLFGFERIAELLREKVTVAGLAAAAQSFGQEDDITVLAVTRAATAY
jgi:sigma-B regulation protein RsbU (phosphoserine phosphatase)